MPITKQNILEAKALAARGMDQPLRELVFFLVDDYVARNGAAPAAPAPVVAAASPAVAASAAKPEVK